MRSLLPTERASYSDVRALVVLAHKHFMYIVASVDLHP